MIDRERLRTGLLGVGLVVLWLLPNGDTQASEEALRKSDAETAEAFHLERGMLCEDRSVPVYAIIDAAESSVDMQDSCGKMYVMLFQDGEERALTAGSFFYPERIDPQSYDRYRLWFATFMTMEGAEPRGTSAFEERSIEDPILDRSAIVTKYLGNDDQQAWLLYDIGLAGYGEGTVVQFYSMPYTMKEDLVEQFYEGNELQAAGILRNAAEHWFRENASLLTRESSSPQRQ